jgi:hypothetical protein
MMYNNLVVGWQERWKWRRKSLEGLIPAMEMARSAVGRRRMKGRRDRSDKATGFGA